MIGLITKIARRIPICQIILVNISKNVSNKSAILEVSFVNLWMNNPFLWLSNSLFWSVNKFLTKSSFKFWLVFWYILVDRFLDILDIKYVVVSIINNNRAINSIFWYSFIDKLIMILALKIGITIFNKMFIMLIIRTMLNVNLFSLAYCQINFRLFFKFFICFLFILCFYI